ncbi:MAG: 30S ribosomal protein S2 [Bacteroidales bacterium]|nr:30S ribosomal protein S2 [Bacteroidales bacterium]
MPRTNFKELLDAGCHFGHLKRKWNPHMAPYIFMERNGIHIIDLQKTAVKIEDACNAVKQIAKSGRKILFVATKKQAKEIVAERVKKTGMPFVTERWPGGMLTNFPTIRKAVKKMTSIDKLMSSESTFASLSKREKLQITRQRAKLEKNLGSISEMTRLPAAMFVVDISKENIAVREAKRLNIPVFGIVDTNSDPNLIEFPIPANDDASKSISLIVDLISTAIEEGLNERKLEKDKESSDKDKEKKGKSDQAKETKGSKETREKKEKKELEEDNDKDDKKEEKKPVAKKAPAKKAPAKKDSEKKAEKKDKEDKPTAKKAQKDESSDE